MAMDTNLNSRLRTIELHDAFPASKDDDDVAADDDLYSWMTQTAPFEAQGFLAKKRDGGTVEAAWLVHHGFKEGKTSNMASMSVEDLFRKVDQDPRRGVGWEHEAKSEGLARPQKGLVSFHTMLPIECIELRTTEILVL